MYEVFGSILIQARCIFEVLLHWKHWPSIKVEVMSP